MRAIHAFIFSGKADVIARAGFFPSQRRQMASIG
jgi:hypothetical protein